MNQKPLALAIAAVLAAPFAVQAGDVTIASNTTLSISGLLAAGVKNVQVTDSVRGVKSETRLDDNTSRITFSGRTDLGSGNYAIFRVESRLTSDVRPGTCAVPVTGALLAVYPNGCAAPVSGASGLADGDSFVGFTGPWGTATFGKSSMYVVDTFGIPALGLNSSGEHYRVWDVQAISTFNILDNVWNGAANAATLGITRSQNVLRYDSPNMSGFVGSIGWSKNPNGDENRITNATAAAPDYEAHGTVWARLNYNAGPPTATASMLDQELQGGIGVSANKKAYRLGLGYEMSGFKFGAVYDNTTVENGVAAGLDAKRGAWMIPVSYKWDANQAYFTYTKAGNTSNVAGDSGAKQMVLGYDRELAKNVFVGAFYTKLTNDTNGGYKGFLTDTSFGGTGNLRGEGFRQLSLNVNYYF